MKRLPLALALLCVTGCLGAEPRISSAPPELLAPPSDGRGVAVLPPQGLAPDFAARLHQAITDALIAVGTPASQEAAPRAGALVASAAKLSPAATAGEETLQITWAAQLPGAAAPIYLTQTESVAAGQGEQGPPLDRLRVIAGRAAAALAEVLNPTGLTANAAAAPDAAAAAPAAAPPPKPSFAVRVGKVTGAPGDGDVSLARSMGFSLRELTVPVTDKDGPAVWRIDGKVTAAPPQGDKRKLTVRWALIDPTGQEQAAAEQANDVPAAAIANAWGPLAALVTQAAAEGLAQALSDAKRATDAAPIAAAAPPPPTSPAPTTPAPTAPAPTTPAPSVAPAAAKPAEAGTAKPATATKPTRRSKPTPVKAAAPKPAKPAAS